MLGIDGLMGLCGMSACGAAGLPTLPPVALDDGFGEYMGNDRPLNCGIPKSLKSTGIDVKALFVHRCPAW